MNINRAALRPSLMTAIYVLAIIPLIFITPLYGDPAVVYWTGKVVSGSGSAFDPACINL